MCVTGVGEFDYPILSSEWNTGKRVWMGGGYKCQLSVKISPICQLSVKF